MSDSLHVSVPAPIASAPTRRVDVYIGLVIAAALSLGALTVVIELASPMRPVNWKQFAVFALLLLVSETTSTSWLRFGDGGVVTLSWTFGFALVLLGSPAAAVATMAVATLMAELKARNSLVKVLFNTAQVSLALTFGGLTLFAFGVHGPIAENGTIPVVSGLAMLLAGILVFVSNGVLLCYLLAAISGKGFISTMRDGFALSMTADGALLALAPIFTITTGYSLLLLPLMGIAAFLVYQTARQSLASEHEANHDTLTSLLNRRSFDEEIGRFVLDCGFNDAVGGVLLLDLDGFKGINDRLGHQVGDQLLRAFAHRLSEVLPPSAVVARLGGDEFAVLLPRIQAATCVTEVRALHAALTLPMIVEDFPLAIGASIGVALYPSHGEGSTELLGAADSAMYRAKQFKTGVELFVPSSSGGGRGRRSLLGDLHRAVGTDQLSVVYQPQVHMRDRSVLAVEALVRWTHPTLGSVAPDDFIGLAEQTELIGPITEFVMGTAIRDIVQLGDLHIDLAVNVSARNLHDRHFARTTLSTLDRFGFEPRRLELEITERALTSEPERAQATLTELRAAGVRISIDDFGTGYSSYLTVRELRVDRLKIDKTFVLELGTSHADRVVVQSVIGLAHGLGIEVVGEGVENEAAWTALTELGCDIAQGYLIARPMSIDDLVTWRMERIVHAASDLVQ